MIKNYAFGKIEINSGVYTSDVIIYPDKVDSSWWRKQGHLLVPEDLQDAVKAHPDILVVGTGDSGLMRVPDSTKQWIRSQGTELVVEPTKKACSIYNNLCESEESKKIIAALHLTC